MAESVYSTSCLCGDVTMQIPQSLTPLGQSLCQPTDRTAAQHSAPQLSTRSVQSDSVAHSAHCTVLRCAADRWPCAGHCTNCTLWHGTPMAGAILHRLSQSDPSQPFAPLSVSNQPQVAAYSKTGSVQRHFCRRCGSHLFVSQPQRGVVVLQPGLWRASGMPFQPSVHLNYEKRQVPVPDGLVKYKDFPKEYGGTGEQCSE